MIFATHDHKPTDIDERKRIKDCGGLIVINGSSHVNANNLLIDAENPKKITNIISYQEMIDRLDAISPIDEDGKYHITDVMRQRFATLLYIFLISFLCLCHAMM